MANNAKSLPFELILTKKGKDIDCRYRFSHSETESGGCSHIVVAGDAIRITLDFNDYKSYLTGTLAHDHKSMTGTFTTTGGQGTWNLKWKAH